MVAIQNCRYINVTPPASTTGSVTTAVIDTVAAGDKYDFATVVVTFGSIGATVVAMKMQESDASGSGFTDITGMVAPTDFSLPVASTDNDKQYVFHIDLRGRKRYLDLVLTAGATATLVNVTCMLSRGKQAPITATDSNVAVLIVK